MSSSKSVPQTTPNSATVPDYEGLVRFLLQPFLDSPESLRVDCEKIPSKPKVLVRLAFEDADKGRVFGRGGRNIQAIQTALEAIAQQMAQSVYLDIYGGIGQTRERDSLPASPDRPSPKPVRRSPRPVPKTRF